MLENKGHFKLIDIISTKYNDKTYFFGNVYYSESDFGDLVRVSCSADDVAILNQYVGQDVTNLIKIEFNRYKKTFTPKFVLN